MTVRRRAGRNHRADVPAAPQKASRRTTGRGWHDVHDVDIAARGRETEGSLMQGRVAVGAQVIWNMQAGPPEGKPGGSRGLPTAYRAAAEVRARRGGSAKCGHRLPHDSRSIHGVAVGVLGPGAAAWRGNRRARDSLGEATATQRRRKSLQPTRRSLRGHRISTFGSDTRFLQSRIQRSSRCMSPQSISSRSVGSNSASALKPNGWRPV